MAITKMRSTENILVAIGFAIIIAIIIYAILLAAAGLPLA